MNARTTHKPIHGLHLTKSQCALDFKLISSHHSYRRQQKKTSRYISLIRTRLFYSESTSSLPRILAQAELEQFQDEGKNKLTQREKWKNSDFVIQRKLSEKAELIIGKKKTDVRHRRGSTMMRQGSAITLQGIGRLVEQRRLQNLNDRISQLENSTTARGAFLKQLVVRKSQSKLEQKSNSIDFVKDNITKTCKAEYKKKSSQRFRKRRLRHRKLVMLKRQESYLRDQIKLDSRMTSYFANSQRDPFADVQAHVATLEYNQRVRSFQDWSTYSQAILRVRAMQHLIQRQKECQIYLLRRAFAAARIQRIWLKKRHEFRVRHSTKIAWKWNRLRVIALMLDSCRKTTKSANILHAYCIKLVQLNDFKRRINQVDFIGKAVIVQQCWRKLNVRRNSQAILLFVQIKRTLNNLQEDPELCKKIGLSPKLQIHIGDVNCRAILREVVHEYLKAVASWKNENDCTKPRLLEYLILPQKKIGEILLEIQAKKIQKILVES